MTLARRETGPDAANEAGDPVGAPLQGQALLYFGGAPDSFFSEFKGFGFCVRTEAPT